MSWFRRKPRTVKIVVAGLSPEGRPCEETKIATFGRPVFLSLFWSTWGAEIKSITVESVK